MKRLLYLLIFGLNIFLIKSADAQLLPPNQPEQNACDALVLCGNSFFSPYSYVGIGTISDLTNTPCSGGEGNAVWLRLNVTTGGIIVFTITPVDPADDYDFAIADISNGNCNAISMSNIIRCNFNNNAPVYNNGILGLNTTSTLLYNIAGATGGSYLQQINANAGDVYLIMINNFGQGTSGTNPSSGFTIDFTGTTATFNGTNPSLGSVIPSCNNAQQITVQMSENIKCSSIASDGSDFAISGGGVVTSATGINCSGANGYTDKVVLNFGSSLPSGIYTLSAQVGTDGNSLLNLCDHPVLLPDAIQLFIPPYVAPEFVAIDTPACSEIRIKLATRVRCDSIAKDGSDFAITGPQADNIIAAYGIGCDTLNFSDTVLLLLQTPLITDGVYTITAQKGSDGNTLMDSCGLTQAIGDAITININSYDGLVVSSPDTILCNAQYLQLNAANNSKPPFASVNCDTFNTICTGNTAVVFVGTKDSTTDINSPFYGGSQDARSQYLFRASELRAMGLKPGSIHTLEWKVTQKLSTLPYTNFTIKIGCTPLSDLSGSFLSVSQVVYTTAAYNTVPGWNTFNLTTPYNWDGVSNLIVEVCYDNVSTSFNDRVAHSITPFGSVYRRYGNNLSGCSIVTEGSANSNNNLRAKLRFHICEPPLGQPIYAWTPGNFLSDSTIQQPLAYIARDITYGVTAIDKYGCLHKDSSVITTSIRHSDLYPKDTTICLGEKVKLNASGGLNYNWVAVDLTTLNCITCPDPIVTPLETSIYNVIISDQYNCADTLNARIIVNPLPGVTIYPNDTIVKYGASIQLTASGAYLYSWSPPSALSNPNIPNPIATFTHPEVISLIGIDENGCRNVDTLRVGVDYSDAVFIPSAFSPNGDGKNDLFKLGSVSFQKITEFRIFNRWGQEIFSTTDPLKGWDGTYKGVLQDAGVYQYFIRTAYPDGKTATYKGDITLIK